MSNEIPNDGQRIHDLIAVSRSELTEKETKAIDELFLHNADYLDEEDVLTLRYALYTRVASEREKFLAEITEMLLKKESILSESEISSLIKAKKTDYEKRIIELILSIYSEFQNP